MRADKLKRGDDVPWSSSSRDSALVSGTKRSAAKNPKMLKIRVSTGGFDVMRARRYRQETHFHAANHPNVPCGVHAPRSAGTVRAITKLLGERWVSRACHRGRSEWWVVDRSLCKRGLTRTTKARLPWTCRCHERTAGMLQPNTANRGKTRVQQMHGIADPLTRQRRDTYSERHRAFTRRVRRREKVDAKCDDANVCWTRRRYPTTDQTESDPKNYFDVITVLTMRSQS